MSETLSFNTWDTFCSIHGILPNVLLGKLTLPVTFYTWVKMCLIVNI